MLIDAFEFYYKAARLKEMLRQGPLQWRVTAERKEGIAEHIYGTQILAIGLYGELGLTLDLGKTLEMLAIHELEEIGIGDITPLDDVDKASMKQSAKSAVLQIVSCLSDGGKDIARLTDEFNAATSPEARFAKAVDKLECVLEFKKYQDRGQVSLNNITDAMLKNKRLKAMVESKKYDLADIFFAFHKEYFEEFGINEKFWKEKLKPLKVDAAKS